MRCPNLKDLPAPPKGKSGWPWTQESQQLPDKMPDGRPWPKISIVTPNYNYAQFIEETIRSVLLQGYPNFEYIIIDDGSIDNSVEIIKRYEKWLTYWTRQPNQGQVNAINKGIRMISGEVFNWINSDDLLNPRCLLTVSSLYCQDSSVLICGYCLVFDSEGKRKLLANANLTVENFILHWNRKVIFNQPSVWVPVKAVPKAGLLDNSFEYFFDWDMMIRLLEIYPVRYTTEVLTQYRIHPTSKTYLFCSKFENELRVITEKYISQPKWKKLNFKFKRYYSMVDWQDEVSKIRTADFGRLRKASMILIKALRNFDRLRNRFTWGALRRVLLYG